MGNYDALPSMPTGHVPNGIEWQEILSLLKATGLNGGLLDEQYQLKRADTTFAVSSTTMQNDPDLVFTVQPNADYSFYGQIAYAGAAGVQIKVGFTVPSGTLRWTSFALDPSVTASGVGAQDTALRSGSTPTLGVNGIGSKLSFHPVGTFNIGATGGQIHFQAAQATSSAANGPIIGTGSFIILKRLA